MTHVCFYNSCSDCVGVRGNVCCVEAVVKNSEVLSLGVLKYVVGLWSNGVPINIKMNLPFPFLEIRFILCKLCCEGIHVVVELLSSLLSW